MNTKLLVPVTLILVGAGWLLSAAGVLPGMHWVWPALLIFAGVWLMASSGIDRFTFVVGPWLIVAAVCSLVRQRGMIDIKLEAPILVIALGVLMLLARTLNIRSPKWEKN
jgi:hypothetical protein